MNSFLHIYLVIIVVHTGSSNIRGATHEYCAFMLKFLLKPTRPAPVIRAAVFLDGCFMHTLVHLKDLALTLAAKMFAVIAVAVIHVPRM